MADQIPESELVVLDGLRHAMMIEARDRMARLVRDWVLERR
jgi:hypothetical protein